VSSRARTLHAAPLARGETCEAARRFLTLHDSRDPTSARRRGTFACARRFLPAVPAGRTWIASSVGVADSVGRAAPLGGFVVVERRAFPGRFAVDLVVDEAFCGP
jgi:hypothetical protein